MSKSPAGPHDNRVMESTNRGPKDPFFNIRPSTACRGDSGSPVFYKTRRGKYLLQGIHRSGPRICGNPDKVTFDTAILVSAIAKCPWTKLW